MIISGSAKLKEVSAKNSLTASGRLSIDGGKLADITLCGRKFSFDNAQLTKIYVKNDESSSLISFLGFNLKKNGDSQIIKLTNCKVAENITFESGKGTVKMDRNTTITGQIIGGKIVYI